MTTSGPITRDDIEARFRAIQGEAEAVEDEARRLRGPGRRGHRRDRGPRRVPPRTAPGPQPAGGHRDPAHLMALLDPIRSQAISRGLFGNSRTWLVIGAVVWGIRAISWARRPVESTIFREVIEPGQTLVIAASGPPPSKTRPPEGLQGRAHPGPARAPGEALDRQRPPPPPGALTGAEARGVRQARSLRSWPA